MAFSPTAPLRIKNLTSGKPEIGAQFGLCIFSYTAFRSLPRIMFKPADDFLTARRLHDS
jgi:hypothetical protein